MIRNTTLFTLACALALCGCGDRNHDARRSGTDGAGETLPAPSASGSVTGTADVASGGENSAPSLGAGPQPEPTETLPEIDGLPGATNPETGMGMDPDGDGPLQAPPTVDTGAAEPTAADAVAVLRNYYAAINARSYPNAYALWADGGNASGQSPQQFAGGFVQTHGVSVQLGAPGAEDAGAGQRYIQVPVSLTTTQSDGSSRRFAGTYILHRTVVDGATQDQRSWRIQSADLREVSP